MDSLDGMNKEFTLWLFNIAMEAMAHRKFDGSPFLIAWWIFPWQTVNVVPRWYPYLSHVPSGKHSQFANLKIDQSK